MIPFLDNEHTRGSLPLKLWEYVAAGLPVVARDLPNFIEPAREGVVTTASDAPAFVSALEEALQQPPDRRRTRLDAARRHDWPQRIEQMCDLIGQALGRGPRGR